MSASRQILAVTGLSLEARIASGAGVTTLAGGGDPARLALLLQAALTNGARAVISFGIAGGLEPGLRPGTAIIGRSVSHCETRAEADPAWIEWLSAALPRALVRDLAGVDGPVCGVDSKRALHLATGAVAVDMESHIAARLAAQHRVPFAALRVIADPAERTVPSAAAAGMATDGSTDLGAVLRMLGRRPAELPGLLRTAADALSAFTSLVRNRRRLRTLFGFDEPWLEPERDARFARALGADLEVGGFGQMNAAVMEMPAETS